MNKNESNDDLINGCGQNLYYLFVAIMPKVLHKDYTDFYQKWTEYGICIKNSFKVKSQYICCLVLQRLTSSWRLSPRLDFSGLHLAVVRLNKKGQEKTADINTWLFL